VKLGIFCKYEVGLRTLDRLLGAGERPVFVIAREREQGNAWFGDLEERCRSEGVDFHPAGRIRDDASVAYVREKHPDLILSVYYTEIIPPSVLAIPPRGIVNFHPSLLPRYRGPHPVNWAIIRGETKTGLTAHFMDAGVDTGPILLQKEVPIGLLDTTASVGRRLMELTPEMAVEVLSGLRAGTLTARPQDESQATYFPRRTTEDDIIAWERTTKEIYDLIRGLYYPLPGALSWLDGQRIVFRDAVHSPLPVELDGPPGVILSLDASGMWVRTGDGAVLIRRVDLGDKLGINPASPEYTALFRIGGRFDRS